MSHRRQTGRLTPGSPAALGALASLLALATLGALGACSDQTLPTRAPDRSGPSLLISDAVHNYGNVHFYWLMPVVPTNPTFTGTPNDNFFPTVEICQLDAAGQQCDPAVPLVATYTRQSGPNGAKLYVSTATHVYAANFITGQFPGLDVTKRYRATVSLVRTPIGYTDIAVVPTQADADTVNRAESAPVVKGRSLALNFRLEAGAVYNLSPTGGTKDVLNHLVVFAYPGGMLPDERGITIQPAFTAQLPTDQALVDRLAPGSAVELGPEPLVLAQQPTLTITYDVTQLPAGTVEGTLRLHRLENGQWLEVPGSTVDVSSHAVSGKISRLGTYAAVVHHQDLAARELDGGWLHGCNVDAQGHAWCWGYNVYGEVGNGTSYLPSNTGAYLIYPSPQPVSGGLTFAAVYAGPWHSCGITVAGDAYCWGFGAYGQLGNGNTPTSQSTPVAVAGGHKFASLALGTLHSCGVTTTGEAYCWGYGWFGELGNNVLNVATQATPVAVAALGGGQSWVAITAGEFHSCGVTTSGAGLCWGYGLHGQRGDGVLSGQQGTPVAIAGGMTWRALSAGDIHTCGVTTVGAAYCWGYNYYGQTGDGHAGFDGTASGPYPSTPQPVAGGNVFASIASGFYHTCGLTTGGQALCWGFNDFGQLGDGTTNTSSTPVAVAGTDTWMTLLAGGFNTCGVTTGGATKCWGNNGEGELALGATGTPVLNPTAVTLP